MARALAWHARGHEFDSRILHTGKTTPAMGLSFCIWLAEESMRVTSFEKSLAIDKLRLKKRPWLTRARLSYSPPQEKTTPAMGLSFCIWSAGESMRVTSFVKSLAIDKLRLKKGPWLDTGATLVFSTTGKDNSSNGVVFLHLVGRRVDRKDNSRNGSCLLFAFSYFIRTRPQKSVVICEIFTNFVRI